MDLTIGLVIAALLVLAAVALHQWWLLRKMRPKRRVANPRSSEAVRQRVQAAGAGPEASIAAQRREPELSGSSDAGLRAGDPGFDDPITSRLDDSQLPDAWSDVPGLDEPRLGGGAAARGDARGGDLGAGRAAVAGAATGTATGETARTRTLDASAAIFDGPDTFAPGAQRPVGAAQVPRSAVPGQGAEGATGAGAATPSRGDADAVAADADAAQLAGHGVRADAASTAATAEAEGIAGIAHTAATAGITGTDAAPATRADDFATARSPTPSALPTRSAAPARTALRPAATERRIDALIDAIAPLPLEGGGVVSGDFAINHLPSSWRAGTKPFLVEGMDVDDSQWQVPRRGRRYREFQAGVQMANRGGPINEIEYSEFVQKVQRFAEAVGALPDFPDMLDVVARARELDAFAAPLDAQLSLTLRARSVAWSVGYLQQVAGRHGFVAGVLPGRLVMPGLGEGDPPLLALQFDPQAALAEEPASAVVTELTLSLDVPQSPREAEPFPAWHQSATELAREMDALVVDDLGQSVSIGAYDAIGKELQTLYETLESRDLAAGSSAARRLFS